MRILVTGACGMLGQQVCKFVRENHELINTDIVGDCIKMDIIDTNSVFEVFNKYKPEMVIHCAAMTDVDGCTKDPESAYKVNGYGTWNLACASAALDCSFVYVSTDYVFDGDKGEAYIEFDETNPVSAYGASKLAGEKAVKDLLKKFYIVRTSWVFAPYAKNFPLSILKAAETRKELKIVADQVGSPTYAKDLAEFLVKLAGSPMYGTYHFTNKGFCSWYDFAKKILETAGYNDISVVPIKSEEWPTPTKRPEYSVLRHFMLEMQGKDEGRSWEEAVVEFISEWTIAKQ